MFRAAKLRFPVAFIAFHERDIILSSPIAGLERPRAPEEAQNRL